MLPRVSPEGTQHIWSSILPLYGERLVLWSPGQIKPYAEWMQRVENYIITATLQIPGMDSAENCSWQKGVQFLPIPPPSCKSPTSPSFCSQDVCVPFQSVFWPSAGGGRQRSFTPLVEIPSFWGDSAKIQVGLAGPCWLPGGMWGG